MTPAATAPSPAVEPVRDYSAQSPLVLLGIPLAAVETCAALPSITQAVREFRRRCAEAGSS